MTKKTFFLGVIFTLFLIPEVCAELHTAKHTNEMQAVQQISRIDLKGDIEKGNGFRSGSDPIVAEMQGSLLFVSFQKDVDVVRVSVMGNEGEIYVARVNTASQFALHIPLAGFPAGSYTISFSNEYGTMWGEFTI